MKRQVKKLTLVVLRRPFITPVIVMLQKKEAENHRLGAHKFSRSLSSAFHRSVCIVLLVAGTEKVEIYGNFPSAGTAFPRHYALWQYL